MSQILNYLDNPETFVATRPGLNMQLLFKAEIIKGPGLDEALEWYLGPSDDGRFVGLWVLSSLDEEHALNAVVLASGEAMDVTAELGQKLLSAYWQCERCHYDWTEPNYSYLCPARGALLKTRIVKKVAAQVWPELKHGRRP